MEESSMWLFVLVLIIFAVAMYMFWKRSEQFTNEQLIKELSMSEWRPRIEVYRRMGVVLGIGYYRIENAVDRRLQLLINKGLVETRTVAFKEPWDQEYRLVKTQ